MTSSVARADHCTACGSAVRRMYEEGFDFLHKVFQHPNELERVRAWQRCRGRLMRLTSAHWRFQKTPPA